MIQLFRKWFDQYFADEEAMVLLLLVGIILFLVFYMGSITAPILASIVVAYLLQGAVFRLQRWVPNWLAFSIVYSLFIGGCLLVLLVFMPLLFKQVAALAAELPKVVGKLQHLVGHVQQLYPDLLSPEQSDSYLNLLAERIGNMAQQLVGFSFSSLGNLFTFVVYAVLIPLMVFFFLRDRDSILQWLGSFLPKNRPMMQQVWLEMNQQVANYARGKALEVLIVGSSSFVGFAVLGLNYAALLSFFVGLSVIVPYIGVVVVTLPVVLVGFFQFGYSDTFAYVLGVYFVIQFLDGNVLVPLLFSEAVNIHPLAIVIAVLVFGGLWGFWGVFFAIPLATLFKALLSAWPNHNAEVEQGEPELSENA